MERAYSQHLAQITGRSLPASRQMLRALREADVVPGHGIPPTAENIASIVMALSADTVSAAPERTRTLRDLPLASVTSLPPAAGAMLTALLIARRAGPVFHDYDAEDGSLHLGASSVVLECLTLSGKRVCVRYGADTEGICRMTVIPLPIVAKFTHLF